MGKQVIDYIRQPETLDSQALDFLTGMVERYPYYHAARILLLRTLYQMHDSRFNEELRKAAVFVPSRSTLFELFQATSSLPKATSMRTSRADEVQGIDRTDSLIDDFLDTLPEEKAKQGPNFVDATVDYMAYLTRMESSNATTASAMAGSDYIDQFLSANEGHFTLEDVDDEEDDESRSRKPAYTDAKQDSGTGILTEAMARIYIKQRKFDKAAEIIRRISLKYPEKNRYFADQIRFLEKLIENEKLK